MISKVVIKKAAMFGLDARIALAIFGALSVISGAALYSAIKTAKTEQWRQYLNEIVKASEQYYLDNGKTLVQDSDYRAYASDLITNRESLSTWNGPYISGDVYNINHIKDGFTASLGSTVYTGLFLEQKSDWTANTALVKCASLTDYDCAEYIILHAGNDSTARANIYNLFLDLDESVDNTDGALKGKVRFIDLADDYDFLLYQGIIRKRNM